jgi:hypothetical protein
MKKFKLLVFVVITAVSVSLAGSCGTNRGNTPGEQETTNNGGGDEPPRTVVRDPNRTPPRELSDFPTLRIETDGVPFVEKTLWIDSTFTLTGMEHDDLEFKDIEGEIRGRGMTSWSKHEEKRGLRMKLTSGARAMDYYGEPHRDWVLIANHGDKSLLRNYTAYHLARVLDGMYWSPYTRFLHLYVNGEYMGVYMLADERNVGKQRAEVIANADPALCEYFIEMDWRLYRDGNVEGVDYVRVNSHENGVIGDSRHNSEDGTTRDMLYDVRFPKKSNRTSAHMEYVRDYIESVGKAIRARDYERISALVDMPSMIDFFIVNELIRNSDVGWSSKFMQIKGQGDERRLHMGPVWDFDIAAGNTEWSSNQTPYGFYIQGQHYWFGNLMATPEFREALTERWNALALDAISETVGHVRALATDYRDSFERNFERHKIMGVELWPNPPQVVEIDTFMGQVDYLLDFIERRTGYITEKLNEG